MERRGVWVVFHGQEKACNNNNYCDIFIRGQRTKKIKIKITIITKTKKTNKEHNA